MDDDEPPFDDELLLLPPPDFESDELDDGGPHRSLRFSLSRDDEPDDLVHDLLAETLWPNHVLGKSVIGTPETVSSFTPDDLRKYMARYTPDTAPLFEA